MSHKYSTDDNDAPGRSSGDINSKTALPLCDKEGKVPIGIELNGTIIAHCIRFDWIMAIVIFKRPITHEIQYSVFRDHGAMQRHV